MTTEPIPEARRPDPARLRAIIEARLAWATDVARREGTDLVHTIHQFAADVRQDLALHLPIHPADAPDALGTTRENHT